MGTGTGPYGDCRSTQCCVAVWSRWLESATRLGGFRALKNTLEALYTTKVNNRVHTSRGTSRGTTLTVLVCLSRERNHPLLYFRVYGRRRPAGGGCLARRYLLDSILCVCFERLSISTICTPSTLYRADARECACGRRRRAAPAAAWLASASPSLRLAAPCASTWMLEARRKVRQRVLALGSA